MKFAKLSIAALAVVGFSSSVMALDMSKATIKPYVKTKIYYETVDAGGANQDLFKQNRSSGDAVAQIGATGALNGCWGYGLEYTIADTLGLEQSVVSNIRVGAGTNDGSAGQQATDTRDWMSQAYITFRGCGTALDKTTFKIGRQYLDTPLAFTENWNAAPNSFDAMVAINSDIENVTLVGAVVTGGNGVHGAVANADNFSGSTTLADGAHAVGILTNFGVPVNLWYYNVRHVADAVWADTTIAYSGVKLGLQYGKMMPDAAGAKDSSGGAISLAGSIAGFNLMGAYSQMDDEGTLALANTATDLKKTKLATAGIYTDGTHVAVPGSTAFKLKASTKTPIGKLILQHVVNENDMKTAGAKIHANLDVAETDLILATKVMGISTKLILINRDYDKDNAGVALTTKQHVRIILSKNF